MRPAAGTTSCPGRTRPSRRRRSGWPGAAGQLHDHPGALEAYGRVPESSIASGDAQLAMVRLHLEGADGSTTPDLDELLAATKTVDGLTLDGEMRARLTGEVLEAALRSMEADVVPADSERELLGWPRTDTGVRLGLEQSYRRQARYAATRSSASGWSTGPTRCARGRGHERAGAPGPGRGSDRVETDLGVAAAVTDRGFVHRRNEDAVHLDRVDERGVLAVVCDGVSLSQAPDQAARAGAAAAGRRLGDGLRRGDRPLAALAAEALDAAQRAVADVAGSPGSRLDPPSCTLVLGVCAGGEVAVAWVGDSRAYWVGADGVTQLTRDNSWASQQVGAGVMSEREAGAHPAASRSPLGWASTPRPGPADRDVPPCGPRPAGAVLRRPLGSGDPAPAPAAPAGPRSRGREPPGPRRHLVDLALTAGGRDNITVAILDAPAEGPRSATTDPRGTSHEHHHRSPAWELKIRADRDYFDTWTRDEHTFPATPATAPSRWSWPRSPSAGGTRPRASIPTSTWRPSTATRASRGATPSCCASPTAPTPWWTPGRRTAPGSPRRLQDPRTRPSPWWTATSSTWAGGPPSPSTPGNRASPRRRRISTAPVTARIRRASSRPTSPGPTSCGWCASTSRTPRPCSIAPRLLPRHHRPVPAPGDRDLRRPPGADDQPHRGHRRDAPARTPGRGGGGPGPPGGVRRATVPRRRGGGPHRDPRRDRDGGTARVAARQHGRGHRGVPGRPWGPGAHLRSRATRGGRRPPRRGLADRAGRPPAERSAGPPGSTSSATRPSLPSSRRRTRSTAGPTTCRSGSRSSSGAARRSSGCAA